MTRFRKSLSGMSWPTASYVRRIENRAARYLVDVSEDIANTGSRYLTLDAPDGATTTVRISNHADVYCTSQFTIDPFTNEIEGVYRWIEEHGHRQYRVPVATMRRLERMLKNALPPEYRVELLSFGGPAFIRVTRGSYVAFNLDRDGYHFDLCPADIKQLITQVAKDVLSKLDANDPYANEED